jgi:hypothetical protein
MTSIADLQLPHYLDSSWLTAWRACKRKHFWSALIGIYPSGQSVHLIAGAAIASGMEYVRKAVFDPLNSGTRFSHEELMEFAMSGFVQEWGSYTAPQGHAKSFHNTFAALDDYIRRYNPYDDVVQPFRRPNGEAAIEYKFSIPLDIKHPDSGDPICFVGRFDMLGVYDHPGGQINVLVDEKSTASIGSYWASQWALRGQFLGYCWACQQQGIYVSTACVRGIAIQKTQFVCATALPEYPQWLIDRWYREMYRDMEGIVRAYVAIKRRVQTSEEELDQALEYFLPLNLGDACSSYGGCAFQTLCETNDPWRYTSNYIRHRWDPLKKQPVEEIANESI